MNSTNTLTRGYKITADRFAFSHGMFPLTLLLNDVLTVGGSWETFDERRLQSYFENGCGVFLARLEELRNLRAPLTAQKEKELRFMLEALITAKKTLEDPE